jgi:hypothetical protein
MIPGWSICALELILYFFVSFMFKQFPSFRQMNNITYYWLSMTILTGIWEASYLMNYDEIEELALQLRENNTHVWTNPYSLDYIFPWKLSKIFYAEYGAWADREYMSLSDDWSHTIEGTYAIFCATLSLFGMLTRLFSNELKSLIVISMAMAFQLMNSVLYMVEYGIQCKEIDSVNYNNASFPLGKAMLSRPFMYVNVFWILMPTYILFYELFFLNLNKWRKVTTNHTVNTYTKLESISPIETLSNYFETPPNYFELDTNVKMNNDSKEK